MGTEEAGNQGDEAIPESSRRCFMKTLGISGLVGGVAYVTGDRFGPSSLFIPGLGGRAARGPSYVVFRDEATVYAQSGDTGTIEFQGSATSVLESIADTLSDRGGQIFVRSGEYALSQTFPAGDPGPTLLTGEGRSTSFRNGGQAFDTIELDKIEARDLSFEDLNGVPCYTGISTSVVSRISQSVPLNLRGGRILPNSEVKRLGDYIRVRTTAPGSFPAISTGAAVFNRMTADRSLRVRATVRLAPTSKSAVPFFAEPYKGDFENFLGFLWDPPPQSLHDYATRWCGNVHTSPPFCGAHGRGPRLRDRVQAGRGPVLLRRQLFG